MGIPITIDTPTQMNTRIGRTLKQRGDAVIERAGLTSSQAIRQLYKLAVTYEHDPSQLKALLFPPELSEERETRQRARLEALQAGAAWYAHACATLGLSSESRTPLPDDDTLRFEAMAERYDLDDGIPL